jgi:hypothetical protein
MNTDTIRHVCVMLRTERAKKTSWYLLRALATVVTTMCNNWRCRFICESNFYRQLFKVHRGFTFLIWLSYMKFWQRFHASFISYIFYDFFPCQKTQYNTTTQIKTFRKQVASFRKVVCCVVTNEKFLKCVSDKFFIQVFHDLYCFSCHILWYWQLKRHTLREEQVLTLVTSKVPTIT